MSLSPHPDRALAGKIAARIASRARELGRPRVRLMHVCGTHEDTIQKHGVRSLLPEGVEIIPGPGCPVCVTTAREIDEALALADRGVVVTTFGDLMKVPGGGGRSLARAKADGRDVRVVYSIYDAVKIARASGAETVHVAVGFETTAPSTASVLADDGLPAGFSVLACHRLVPPALAALMADPEVRIDGFIEPGHVSAIIGLRPYEELSRAFRVPQVVAGFEPQDVLMGVLMLLTMLRDGESGVRNEYVRVVSPEGNGRALAAMAAAFAPCDVAWRGFPVIPGSGLRLLPRVARRDARERFGLRLPDDAGSVPAGCLCPEVLKGKAYPDECPLFGADCTPEHPVGACMVSSEGSCGIWHRYGAF